MIKSSKFPLPSAFCLFQKPERNNVRPSRHRNVLLAVERVSASARPSRAGWWRSSTRGLPPVVASTAMNAPFSSPKKTSPVAVVNVPPHDSAGPGCATVHTTLPVWISIAFNSRSRRPVTLHRALHAPPRYDLPTAPIHPRRASYTRCTSRSPVCNKARSPD